MGPPRVGIVVIGAGYWGRKLIGEYVSATKSRTDTELRYVVDSNKDRLAMVGDEFALPRSMLETDPSKVLRDPTVHAVHVATPNDTHLAVGLSVLEAHKHLMLEKPMALTMSDALKLARKAEEESVMLQVGHIFRFNNAISKARELLVDGTIGRPFYYSLSWETLLSPPEGRDIIFDLGPHPVDVLNYISNEWPARVQALGKSLVRKKLGQEEVAQAVAEFDDGTFANFSMSWLYAGPKRRHVSITGPSGTIEVDALNQKVRLYMQNNLYKEYPVVANNTIERMISHFVDSIRVGAPAQNSALVGIMTVRVLSAMRDAMRTGNAIHVL